LCQYSLMMEVRWSLDWGVGWSENKEEFFSEG
jgi:hypothetical protein